MNIHSLYTLAHLTTICIIKINALAIQHWARSNLTGLIKPNAMVTALQATNDKFADKQGLGLRVCNRGTVLYSLEKEKYSLIILMPPISYGSISQAESYRSCFRVTLALHHDDVTSCKENNDPIEENSNGINGAEDRFARDDPRGSRDDNEDNRNGTGRDAPLGDLMAGEEEEGNSDNDDNDAQGDGGKNNTMNGEEAESDGDEEGNHDQGAQEQENENEHTNETNILQLQRCI